MSECSLEGPRKVYNDVTNLAYSMIYVSWSDSILGHILASQKMTKFKRIIIDEEEVVAKKAKKKKQLNSSDEEWCPQVKGTWLDFWP